MQQGVILPGVEPKDYFTHRTLEERGNFKGWQFYGFSHLDDKTVCGVINNLKVLASISMIVIVFEWLSAFKTEENRWVAKRPKQLNIDLAEYDGIRQGYSDTPYFTHTQMSQGSPIKEFCLYPDGYFEVSEHSCAWQQAKEVSKEADNWLHNRKLSSKMRRTFLRP